MYSLRRNIKSNIKGEPTHFYEGLLRQIGNCLYKTLEKKVAICSNKLIQSGMQIMVTLCPICKSTPRKSDNLGASKDLSKCPENG